MSVSIRTRPAVPTSTDNVRGTSRGFLAVNAALGKRMRKIASV